MARLLAGVVMLVHWPMHCHAIEDALNFRQLTYGILSFFPFVPESIYRGTGGTGSARYCYSIWLRHLLLAHAGGMRGLPSTLAELGPGDSVGVGLAALISGVRSAASVGDTRMPLGFSATARRNASRSPWGS